MKTDSLMPLLVAQKIFSVFYRAAAYGIDNKGAAPERLCSH